MAAGREDDRKSQPREPLGLDSFRKEPEDSGLSLEAFSAAFAQMLGSGDEPYELREAAAERSTPAPGDGLSAADEGAPSQADSPTDDACELTPSSILEAILFVGTPDNVPIRAEQVAALMRGVRAVEVDEMVGDLNAKYAADGCPYTIVSEGPGYRLVLRDELHHIRDRVYGRERQARLSQAAIEVLSLVAYNQPLSAEKIDELRGRPSRGILRQLVRRQLLRIDRPEGSRRPVFHTSQRFLHIFGLKSLDELPRSQSLEKD